MKIDLKYIILIIILLSFSCKNSEAEKSVLKTEKEVFIMPYISDEYKLEFLNEVLKDTINVLNTIKTKPYIYRKKFRNKKHMTSHNNEIGFITDIELISKSLELTDSLILYNQIKNDSLKIHELKKFGHNTINWEKIKKEKDSITYYKNYLINKNTISISGPYFNTDLDLGYIEIDFDSWRGNNLLFEKINDKWVFKRQIGNWMQ